ncbi:hypothetical protein B0A55_05994 [Friedmanniomyces simplex]|uniref:Uncharacterized protein n=1 Tax=Friedmanniomyces simplex TaxID=329884 RepID=A0A4U0XE04_9PEZI|nr:hypothetical protein B0A55_05994 [Friedmanniomyces simplex]
MGHMSRIWHVRFLPSRVEEAQGVDMMSFGEDASAILWHLQTLSSSSNASTHILQQYHIDTAHAGKHIWSVAISPSGYIATGASDGAIAVRTSTFGNPPSLPLEIGSPLLGDFSGADTFKAYSFIAPSTVIATTTQGKLIVLKLQAAEIPRIWELAASLSGLRGYSVVTSLPDIGTGWAAGLDGKVYMYVHEHRRLTQVFDAGHKVAGLFAHSRQGHRAIALLVTGVGGVDPTLLLLAPAMAENVNLMPVLRRETRLALAQDFIVTSFSIITRQKGHDYAVLGSRNGDIALYDIDVAAGASVIHEHLLPKAHSKEAVTSLHWVRGDEPLASSSGLLHSTGRDGRHAVHSLHSRNGKWSAELVYCLAPPFGPNIEGVTLRPDNHIWIWGFKGKHFVAHDTTAQCEIMTVECGGAHRNWAFQPEAAGGWFVWTGKAQLYQQQQTQLPYVLINPGGHGREIKALAVSPIEKQIIATGAEDTNIKLWTFSSEEHGEFRCMQTLRKHNTGIQHLQWSRDGRYLFSSGGFEGFCIWRVRPDLPGMGAGVVCEGMHPNSGASDLRIMGFEVRERSKKHDQAGGSSEVHMAYSDSTLKRWHYEFPRKKWSLVSQGEYLTACLTHVFAPTTDFIEQWLATAATDGHVALWNGRQADREAGDELQWTHRHKVHQNAILSVATNSLPDATTLVITGGDDNGIGITRLTQSGGMDTLLMPRAHAAAVTGLIILHSSGGRLTFASAGIDQRLKLWRVTVNIEQSGIDGVEIECVKSDFTAVADVSSLTSYRLADGTKGVLVAGVGMDLWGVQA